VTEERIAKVIARAGYCSRREAEKWIEAGRVKMNGSLVITLGTKVETGALVTIDDKPIAATVHSRLWVYHKPRGLITTHTDPEGRPTVFDNLPSFMPRVISVGRLDINTEGLLLLTNDGELARYLELPSTAWQRKYRVRVFGKLNMDRLSAVARGITIDKIKYKPIEIELEQQTGNNFWLNVTLTEGKNREIKRIFEHYGLQVNRLIRISYGPFTLGNLAKGAVQEIDHKIIATEIGSQAK
jgi:23S rRNA pseudouridine2605 synthase